MFAMFRGHKILPLNVGILVGIAKDASVVKPFIPFSNFSCGFKPLPDIDLGRLKTYPQ